MKNTQRRAAILEQVAAADGPVSAEEIFERLQGRFPTLALSTVYRNLEKLAEDGLIEKEEFKNSYDHVFIGGVNHEDVVGAFNMENSDDSILSV